jgi:hypothetical protein
VSAHTQGMVSYLARWPQASHPRPALRSSVCVRVFDRRGVVVLCRAEEDGESLVEAYGAHKQLDSRLRRADALLRKLKVRAHTSHHKRQNLAQICGSCHILLSACCAHPPDDLLCPLCAGRAKSGGHHHQASSCQSLVQRLLCGSRMPFTITPPPPLADCGPMYG